MPLTLVHITDNHLYADPSRENDGLVPAATLEAVLRAAAAEAPAPDAVVLTGDFTNDDTVASYELARRLVRAAWPAPVPVFFVPGNHEDVTRLESVFVPDFVGPCGGAPLAQAALGQGWRLALLSTFAGPGCCHGSVGAAGWAALAQCLESAEAAGESVLLALHHPPLPPAGDAPPWAGNCLADPQPLLELLQRHACCRVALYGHLHADVCTALGSACTAYCTPSTCTQTRIQSPTWEFQRELQPGYRLLRLMEAGEHTSEVRRVACS